MGTRHRNASISVILFDLDNTLIPTRKGDRQAINKLSEILWEKYSIPSDIAVQRCNSFLRAFRKCPANPNVDLDTWRHLLWTQALGDKYSSLAGEIYLQWLQLRFAHLALGADVRALLTALHRHYLLGLITNGPSHAQWEKVRRLKLEAHFDVILVSGDLPWEKPHRKIFQEACEYLGVEPRHCMMVGDKLETDILGGIQAKLGCTVWIPLTTSATATTNTVSNSTSAAEHMETDCDVVVLDTGNTVIRADYTISNVLELPSVLPMLPSARGGVRRGSATSSTTATATVLVAGGGCSTASAGHKHSAVSKLRSSAPDFDDCNSNGSDGS